MSNKAFYLDKLKTEVNPVKKVGWDNVERAQLRYEHTAGQLRYLGCTSVLDYGCGIGGLYKYVKNDMYYVGYDIVEEYKQDLLIPSEQFVTKFPYTSVFDASVLLGTFTLNKEELSNDAFFAEFAKVIENNITSNTDYLVMTGFHEGVDKKDPKLYYFNINQLVKYLHSIGYVDIKITFPISPYEIFLKAKLSL